MPPHGRYSTRRHAGGHWQYQVNLKLASMEACWLVLVGPGYWDYHPKIGPCVQLLGFLIIGARPRGGITVHNTRAVTAILGVEPGRPGRPLCGMPKEARSLESESP